MNYGALFLAGMGVLYIVCAFLYLINKDWTMYIVLLCYGAANFALAYRTYD